MCPPQHKVHIVQNARLAHRKSSPHPFFRRLENHLHLALQLLADTVKGQGGDQSDDRMAVVAAGVHGPCVAGGKALLLRTVGIGAVFFHIVAVNVHADGHHRPFPAGVDHGAQAGIALRALHIRGVGPLLHRPLHGGFDHAFFRIAHGVFRADHLLAHEHRDPCFFQRLGQKSSGAELCPGRFRVPVQIPAPFHRLPGIFLTDSIECLVIHFSFSPLFISPAGSGCPGGCAHRSSWCFCPWGWVLPAPRRHPKP